MREARAAKGAKAAVVTEKVADKPKSLKEELAEAVKKIRLKLQGLLLKL